MSESAMWTALRPELKGLDPVRIESVVGSGVPDVNYVHGWIELKYEHEWPKRGGPLRLKRYTKEQKAWAVKREAAGGRVYLLLKVGETEWLLFRGSVAARVLGKEPREVLYQHVLARWLRKPRASELWKHLAPPT